MKCRADGCDRDADYKADQLCQKHYFRMRRNGTLKTLFEERKAANGYSRQYRIKMPGRGYQRLYEPGHPLADSQGYVAEHRKIVFEQYGRELPPCQLCGAAIEWSTCHIDHIDNDATNNSPENLRPLCRSCNVWRDYPEQHTLKNNHAIEFGGKTMTAAEWARQPEVDVTGTTILRRLYQGMSVRDALFAEKRTHNGKRRSGTRTARS